MKKTVLILALLAMSGCSSEVQPKTVKVEFEFKISQKSREEREAAYQRLKAKLAEPNPSEGRESEIHQIVEEARRKLAKIRAERKSSQ